MGMYDTVWVECPKCGTKEGFQSKGGDCLLGDYDLDNCPSDVMKNVNRHSPYECEKCKSLFKVDVRKRKAVLVKPTNP